MRTLILWLTAFGSFTAYPQTTLIHSLDSLTTVYEQNNYHGVILVAKGDVVLYNKGYGFSDFPKKIKHSPATEFLVESVGKMFTATAVLQLVEQNKIRLNQTVKELLPEINIKNADKITIHHLLTHTSGLQSPWDHPNWQFKKRYTKQEQMKIVEDVPLAFDVPGKDRYYSNSGYFILGWIVEKVTKQPFDQYFKVYIFKPAGMKVTRHLNDTVMSGKGAQPYHIISSKKYLTQNQTVSPVASAAGGWLSSATDLYLFLRGLTSGKLVSPSTLDMMKTANYTNPKDSAFRFYAYGLETYVNQPLPGTKFYGHNGGGAGFSIDAYFEPTSNIFVVSCTNLYQNSRPVAMNYLRLAMAKPAQRVTPPFTLKLYDLLDSVGIEQFIKNEMQYFRQLGIDLHPGVFAQMNDALDKAGDLPMAIKWMDLARNYYPDEGFLWILSGDNLQKTGDKPGAIKMYEQARDLGIKRNDNRVTQAAKEKLGILLK